MVLCKDSLNSCDMDYSLEELFRVADSSFFMSAAESSGLSILIFRLLIFAVIANGGW